LDSFGRIGTFQWVSLNPNEKNFSSHHTVAKIQQSPVSAASASPARRVRAPSSNRKYLSHILFFSKQMRQIPSERESPSRPTSQRVNPDDPYGWAKTQDRPGERQTLSSPGAAVSVI
jgi:hypothetical protein